MPSLDDLKYLLAQQLQTPPDASEMPQASFDNQAPQTQVNQTQPTVITSKAQPKNYDDVSEDDLDDTTEAPTADENDYGVKDPSVREMLLKKIQAGQDQFAAAQEQARQNRMGVGIAQALSAGTAAATGAQAPTDLYKNLMTDANAPVTNLKASQQNQADQTKLQTQALTAQSDFDKADPTSKISEFTRQVYGKLAESLGIDSSTLKGMSAQDIEDVKSGVLKIDEVQARVANNKLHYATLADIAGQKRDTQAFQVTRAADDKEEKDAAALGKNLDLAKSSSRSPIGKAANNYNAASRIQALIAPVLGHENDLNDKQVYELARSVDSLLSQTGATVGGSEHLTPQTALGNINKFKNYITGLPGGAGQGGYVKQMYQTALREQGLSKKQIDAEIDATANAGEGSRLQKTNPTRFKNIIDSYRKSFYGADQDQAAPQGPSPEDVQAELKKRNLLK